jgi:hypothetical protein
VVIPQLGRKPIQFLFDLGFTGIQLGLEALGEIGEARSKR